MASSIRNKTVRRSTHDISANVIDFAVNDNLQKLIAAEAGTAYKRPWHRLERGLRLNRLRAFSEDFATKRGINDTDKQSLLTLLTNALNKGLLNSKTSVEYDQEKESITEIKPLVMHENSKGEVLFKLLEKRNAVTFRKRANAPTVAPAAEETPGAT
jgi:hypothetical protein